MRVHVQHSRRIQPCVVVQGTTHCFSIFQTNVNSQHEILLLVHVHRDQGYFKLGSAMCIDVVQYRFLHEVSDGALVVDAHHDGNHLHN